jgi:hypothetical protein
MHQILARLLGPGLAVIKQVKVQHTTNRSNKNGIKQYDA